MVNIDELNKAISELESQDTTFATCERLSWLYTVRNNLGGQFTIESGKVPKIGSSEFLEVCHEIEITKVLTVLDEHLECIKALYPKEYCKILKKITE